jgi:riboflavin kinase/FMN adenylyltransferase
VIGGDKRGRLLGYPTLNLEPPSSRKLLPPNGVYAVRVQTPQGVFGGMLNLGPRPTFDDHERRIEAHIFDASHDWYGANVRLDFVAWLRETRTFPGVDARRRRACGARSTRGYQRRRAVKTSWSFVGPSGTSTATGYRNS